MKTIDTMKDDKDSKEEQSDKYDTVRKAVFPQYPRHWKGWVAVILMVGAGVVLLSVPTLQRTFNLYLVLAIVLLPLAVWMGWSEWRRGDKKALRSTVMYYISILIVLALFYVTP